MARPKNADAERTRARILEAALALLRDDPTTLSVRQVARNADVSGAVVHHYFGSQDDLVDACIETMYRKADALLAEQRDALAEGRLSPADAIEQTVRLGYRFAREHSALVQAFLARTAARGELDYHRTVGTEVPILAMASAILAQRLGLSQTDVRIRLKTMAMTVTRWAISSDAEIERVTGRSGASGRRVIEDHVVHLAHLLFPV